MHILHTAVRMPREKVGVAAARVGRAFPNAKVRRAIDVDRLLASPYEPALRAAVSARALLSGGFWRTSAALTAAVPAGKIQNAAYRRICIFARRAAVFRMTKTVF